MFRKIESALARAFATTLLLALSMEFAVESSFSQGLPLKQRVSSPKPEHTVIDAHQMADRIIVKFCEGSRIREKVGQWVALAEERSDAEKSRLARVKLTKGTVAQQVQAVNDLLKARSGLRWTKLFDRPESDLEREKVEGEQNVGEELADLNLYYGIHLAQGTATETERLIDQLNALDIVEIAYPETIPVAPACQDIDPPTPNYTPRQGYLNPAPQGIDARYAWTFRGGRGENIKIIDVEQDWNLDHENLPDTFFGADQDRISPVNLGNFQPERRFVVGTGPSSVAVADFDGDGLQDVAVANFGSDNVSILLGNGFGVFGAPQNFAVGSAPRSVIVGDFNSDGNLDLAVANEGSNNVSILFGNGDSTFQEAQNYGVGQRPLSIAVGDFNEDGIPDLAVANNFSNNISILLGNPDGTFQAARNFGAGSFPRSVTVGDFNSDGHMDLAVANENDNNVSVLLGNGNGTFQAAQNFGVGSRPWSVAVGDFNGDAIPDLVVANLESNNVSLLLGNGNGTFQPPRSFAVGSHPYSVVVADFNTDGRLDLAVANEGSDNVSVLVGHGNGTFWPASNFSVSVGDRPLALASGYFYGDKHPDLVVADHGSARISLLINRPNSQHGTAVLGILAGCGGGCPGNFGVSGIVHRADIGVSTTVPFPFVAGATAGAINNAAAQLQAGDVILLEAQETGPACNLACNCVGTGLLPPEWTQAVFDVISNATAMGIIVVETAGNGGNNLDCPQYGGLFDRATRNSRAIFVGAGDLASRSPMPFTNYGRRLDLQGWGTNVMTAGYGDLRANGPDENQWYTASFNGTSSAGPIVAGAVAAIQGINLAQGRPPLPLIEIVNVLRTTGTPQAADQRQIGPLPDLKKAILRLDLRWKVAVVGDPAPAPVGGTFSAFGVNTPTPSQNNRGDVVFQASVAGGTAAQGIFLATNREIRKVVTLADAPPIGRTFRNLYLSQQALSDDLSVAFSAMVVNQPSDAPTGGIFLAPNGGSIRKVVAGNDPYPGGARFLEWLDYPPSYSLNSRGDIAFYGTIAGPPDSGFSLVGIFLAPNDGPIRNVANAVGRSPDGGTFAGITSFSVNSNRDVAFSATVIYPGPRFGGGIFLAPDGGPARKVVVSGDPTPIGGTFYSIDGYSLNSLGDVAFFSGVTGGSAPSGIFLALNDGRILTVVAVGDANPILCGIFRSFDSKMVSVTDSRAVAFGVAPGSDIYLANPEPLGTSFQKVVLIGDNIPVPTGSTFNRIGNMSLNNSGHVAFYGAGLVGPYGIFLIPGNRLPSP
jgi:predicted NUDIX family NTP pyrophosphohydrolase